jgi:hypothetical protein
MAGDTLSLQQIGGALQAEPMESPYDDVPFQEKIRVTMPKDLLINCQSSGLTIRLYGERRDLDLTIPAEYIQGFLRKT